MCFGGGGGGGSSTPTQTPPPPTDTPAPAGTDSAQRFQDVRARFAPDEKPSTVLNPDGGSYGRALGATVLGAA